MKSDHRYFWIGHSVVGLRVPGATSGPFAKPTQLATISSTNPRASGSLVVFGLTALPGARLTFRFRAKPRHWSMNGARHAMKALSTPGWTMISMTMDDLRVIVPFLTAHQRSIGWLEGTCQWRRQMQCRAQGELVVIPARFTEDVRADFRAQNRLDFRRIVRIGVVVGWPSQSRPLKGSPRDLRGLGSCERQFRRREPTEPKRCRPFPGTRRPPHLRRGAPNRRRHPGVRSRLLLTTPRNRRDLVNRSLTPFTDGL